MSTSAYVIRLLHQCIIASCVFQLIIMPLLGNSDHLNPISSYLAFFVKFLISSLLFFFFLQYLTIHPFNSMQTSTAFTQLEKLCAKMKSSERSLPVPQKNSNHLVNTKDKIQICFCFKVHRHRGKENAHDPITFIGGESDYCLTGGVKYQLVIKAFTIFGMV